ncbi:MAG: hypothetical protein HW401_236 [Parcubacteria group bacterium]|nr:hypothetical protein [Parcubacteria group bacterium]
MNPLTAKKIAQILLANGLILSRQKGSHQIYKNIFTGIIAPIPLHGKNKPLPFGTFLAIIKQSKIPKDRFSKHN